MKRIELFTRAWIFGSCCVLLFVLGRPLLHPLGIILKPYLEELGRPSHPIAFINVLLVLAVLAGWTFFSKIFNSLFTGLFTVWFGSCAISAIFFWIGFEINDVVNGIALSLIFLVVAIATFPNGIALDRKTSAIFKTDFPLDEGGTDTLGRLHLVRDVVSAIRSDRPGVIAITGEYGAGKTSFVNLVVGELRKFKGFDAPLIIRFNPWLPSDATTLVLSLMASVLDEVEKRFYLPGANEEARQIAKIVSSTIPHGEKLSSIFDEPSQERKLQRLRAKISAVSSQIIVVLDDMDRLQADELEVLLKILKGSPDNLKNVTFLCAFDKAEVGKILLTSRPHQDMDRFLQKFFPLEFPLPRIDAVKLRDAFTSGIQEVIKEI